MYPLSFGDPVVVRVEIAAPYVDAAFTFAIQSGLPPLTVADLSAGYLTQWNWDFGDGHTSADQNPVHAYTSPGTYTVTLTISSTNGTNIETRTNFIMVGAKGDINSDGNVDLMDALLALQVVTGRETVGLTVCGCGRNNRIGMAEAIYLMQKAARMAGNGSTVAGPGNPVNITRIKISVAMSTDMYYYLVNMRTDLGISVAGIEEPS